MKEEFPMNKPLWALALLLCGAAWCDTIQIEGTGVTRRIRLTSQDVVKIEAVETTVTLEGSGDIVNLDGSDNKLTAQGSLNGLVITGSSNQVIIRGRLHQLDVRGCDNQITLDGPCDLIQYGGSGNRTRWIQRSGSKPPKVERSGWDNLFEVNPPGK